MEKKSQNKVSIEGVAKACDAWNADKKLGR